MDRQYGPSPENATGFYVEDLAVSGKSVKFVAVGLQRASFDLTLGPDGRMKGTISSPVGSLPVVFKRTGEAKVKLIPASPAVSKELEFGLRLGQGSFQGTLSMEGTELTGRWSQEGNRFPLTDVNRRLHPARSP